MQSVIIDQQIRFQLPNEVAGTYVGFHFKSVKRARCVPCLNLAGFRKLRIVDCCKVPHFHVVVDSVSFRPGDYYVEIYRQSGPQKEADDPLIFKAMIRIKRGPSNHALKSVICCN